MYNICDVLGGGVSLSSSRSAALHHLRASACPPPMHHRRVSRCRSRETRALTPYCGRSLAFGSIAATLGSSFPEPITFSTRSLLIAFTVPISVTTAVILLSFNPPHAKQVYKLIYDYRSTIYACLDL